MTRRLRSLASRALALSALAASVAWSRTGHAFYTRGYFDASASVAGAGKLYYTGSLRERRWTCAGCHVGKASPGLQVRFASTPPELAQSARYVPGTLYEVTATLIGETRGFDSQFNSNGFLVEMSRGIETAGQLSEGPTTELIGDRRIIISRNDTSGLSSWVFRWTAPEPGFGPVVVNLGAVDGDGANDSALSRQDHLNDGVFMGTLELREDSSASARAQTDKTGPNGSLLALTESVPAPLPELATQSPTAGGCSAAHEPRRTEPLLLICVVAAFACRRRRGVAPTVRLRGSCRRKSERAFFGG